MEGAVEYVDRSNECCKLLSRLGVGLEHNFNFNADADVGGLDLDYVSSNKLISV